MSLHQHQTLHQPLSLELCNRLRSLLQQMVRNAGTPTIAVSELTLATAKLAKGRQDCAPLPALFTLVISADFSALLLGDRLPQAATDLCKAQITFEPEAIASFGHQLAAHLSRTSTLAKQLKQALAVLGTNNPLHQSEFTQELLGLLMQPLQTPMAQCSSDQSSFKTIEAALQPQVEQERLLNQVITQIRQSLELPVILETAVQQVRHFLVADRLVIYQCQRQTGVPEAGIVYEARVSASVGSILHVVESNTCLKPSTECHEKYRQGTAVAIADTEVSYADLPCLLELVRRHQIRAKLVVPIVLQDELWGLLIAHQCQPRVWTETEQAFLKHTAEHLAIAIQQASLYAQLQQQQQTLKQRVIERTQELYDTLQLAQSANQAKSEFLATMSHELRTPLTCVIGMSATLLRSTLGELTPKQRDYLKTIHSSGEHLLSLINDILDLSQVESGKAFLTISEFSLSRLAQQVMRAIEERAQSHQVQLILDLRLEASRSRFVADQRRVRQILLNLLSNAIKFTPDGGQVILRVWREGETAVLQVEDTGIGIPEHQRPLLFQKFQQLDTSYRRKYGGTGLGLALTKQLVELHRGWINVESSVGVGSTFTVHLPAQTRASSSAIAPPSSFREQPSEPLQGNIVLIQEHEESAMLICDILTAAGYQVVWMVEGITALKQIEILQPAAVITDTQLPSIDGDEVIRYLRSVTLLRDLRILALVPKATPADYVAYLEMGADDYLTKPIHPEQLLIKVNALMSLTVPPVMTLGRTSTP